MNAAEIIRAEMRAEFGDVADDIHIQPGRTGWMKEARTKARAHCLEAQRKAQRQQWEAQRQREREQRAQLVVPREGRYTLCIDGRTETWSTREDQRAVRKAIRKAGLQVSDFVRVYLDGSGRGSWGWPHTGYIQYPKGTFYK